MSHQFSSRSMDVIALQNGHFGVKITTSDALPQIVGGFETREEADAWVLQQGMSEDESVLGGTVLRPGPSQDVG